MVAAEPKRVPATWMICWENWTMMMMTTTMLDVVVVVVVVVDRSAQLDDDAPRSIPLLVVDRVCRHHSINTKVVTTNATVLEIVAPCP